MTALRPATCLISDSPKAAMPIGPRSSSPPRNRSLWTGASASRRPRRPSILPIGGRSARVCRRRRRPIVPPRRPGRPRRPNRVRRRRKSPRPASRPGPVRPTGVRSAATATLSAVPMSIALTLRCAGIVGRWIPPGRKTTGNPEPATDRTTDRKPRTPTALPRSSARTSAISSMSRSESRSPRTRGSP